MLDYIFVSELLKNYLVDYDIIYEGVILNMLDYLFVIVKIEIVENFYILLLNIIKWFVWYRICKDLKKLYCN